MWIRFNERNVETHSQEIIDLLDQEVHGIPGVKMAYARILAKPQIPLIQNTPGPLGTILVAGPTGVGKTESAHALAQILYGSRDRLTYIPCDTLQEPHSLARLIGSPPGYVNNTDASPLADTMLFRGYEEARQQGRLHPLIRGRRESAILLLDEIEKAHPNVRQGLLTGMSTGVWRLTSGRETNSDPRNRVMHSCETPLHNTIIIMTSNVGEHSLAMAGEKKSMGFTAGGISDGDRETHFRRELKREFSPEFLGRVDYVERVSAHTMEDSRAVAKLLVQKWTRAVDAAFGGKIEVRADSISLVNTLVRGVTPALGSRLLAKEFKRRVEDVFENGIPEYFLDSLESTRYTCKLQASHDGAIEFELTPSNRKAMAHAKNKSRDAEMQKLPEIVEALNRYQAVAHLASFSPELQTELEADLKKLRSQLYERGVGQSMIRKLEGRHVENYIRYLDTFMHTYDGVTIDLNDDLQMEISILKGMIRHAHKMEKAIGTPVIDTMLKLLADSGYPELSQIQLQKLAALIHQQHLNAVGIA